MGNFAPPPTADDELVTDEDEHQSDVQENMTETDGNKEEKPKNSAQDSSESQETQSGTSNDQEEKSKTPAQDSSESQETQSGTSNDQEEKPKTPAGETPAAKAEKISKVDFKNNKMKNAMKQSMEQEAKIDDNGPIDIEEEEYDIMDTTEDVFENKLDDPTESDEEDIWSPGMMREMNGLNEEVPEILYYKQVGWGYRVLTRNGPSNASSYRMERATDTDANFEKKDHEDIMDQRLGDIKTGRQYDYRKVHAQTIQGIAPFVDGKNIDYGSSAEEILEQLIPDLPGRPIDVQILVKWYKDGKVEKTWETRTTIRRIWGLHKGDTAIYEAFKYQERRYAEYLAGEREGNSRSPTPGNFRPSPSPDPEYRDESRTPSVPPPSSLLNPRAKKSAASGSPVTPKKTRVNGKGIRTLIDNMDDEKKEIFELYANERLQKEDIQGCSLMELKLFEKYYAAMTEV
ncbi:hypothetical protein H4I96_03596 [Botrytis cinerea]